MLSQRVNMGSYSFKKMEITLKCLIKIYMGLIVRKHNFTIYVYLETFGYIHARL